MRFHLTVSLLHEISPARTERATGEVAGEVAGEVVRLTKTIKGEMKRSDLWRVLNLLSTLKQPEWKALWLLVP